MIIYRLDIHMECLMDGCDSHFVMKKVLPMPIHVLDIQIYLSAFIHDIPLNTSQCDKCNEPMMNISTVEISTIKTIYGDESTGLWICHDHMGKRYYPKPIAQAFESYKKSTKYLHTSRLMESSYKEIARRKFPWKCPICGKFLRYEVERDLGNFYT